MTKEGRNSCLFFGKFDRHILPQESPRWAIYENNKVTFDEQ